jgi:hypothetical protein
MPKIARVIGELDSYLLSASLFRSHVNYPTLSRFLGEAVHDENSLPSLHAARQRD